MHYKIPRMRYCDWFAYKSNREARAGRIIFSVFLSVITCFISAIRFVASAAVGMSNRCWPKIKNVGYTALINELVFSSTSPPRHKRKPDFALGFSLSLARAPRAFCAISFLRFSSINYTPDPVFLSQSRLEKLITHAVRNMFFDTGNCDKNNKARLFLSEQ